MIRPRRYPAAPRTATAPEIPSARRFGRLTCAIALTLVAGPARPDAPVVYPPDGLVSERGLKGFVKADRLPVPATPVLARGRGIWADNCMKCHGGNTATGAPKITSDRDWSPRIAQGTDVLFDHALNGFTGPRFTIMPPRGGHPELTDDDVRSAAAFMIWASGGADAALAYAATKRD